MAQALGWDRQISHLFAGSRETASATTRCSNHRRKANCSASRGWNAHSQHRQSNVPHFAQLPATVWQHAPRFLQLAMRRLQEPRTDSTQLASSLQQIDYTFYQELKQDEITEAYLWSRLEPLLHYLAPEPKSKVQEALSLAYDSHAGQNRKSGEPFITHPVEVTRILAELQMDHESLIAGLLHDTVEDTDEVTFEEIGLWFGKNVRKIVEGETKFSKISKSSCGAGGNGSGPEANDIKAMDLQQLFLSMTEEVRIIVVKLADRLHNMRTLGSMPPHKQKKIADETLAVFAPLARLLGLYSIKEELEDLSFRYSDPEAYAKMQRQMQMLQEKQGVAVAEARAALENDLKADMYLQNRLKGFTVTTHTKAPYSIYRKLQEYNREVRQRNAQRWTGEEMEKERDYEDVRDVAQLRVVLQLDKGQDPALFGSGAQLCYHVMGLVHAKWAPIPGAMKDYIATPKTNSYQSLHTTVVPIGAKTLFPLEIQIRTVEMHKLAEYGIAEDYWGGAPKAAVDLNGASPPTRPQVSPATLNGLQRLFSVAWGSDADPKREPGSLQNEPDPKRDPNGNAGEPNGLQKLLNGWQGKPMYGVVHNVPGLQGSCESLPELDDVVQAGRYGGVKLSPQTMTRRINWLNSIRAWQEEFLDSLTAREFVDCITDELLGRGVFVFTPAGDVLRLPKGATVVDFAYHVHTNLGDQMIAAKVNGKVVPSSHRLANAEVVEVLRYDGQPQQKHVKLHKEWLTFAATKSARHKLAKFLKDHAHLLTDPTSSAPASAGGSAADSAARELDSLRQLDGWEDSWLVVECGDRAGLLADISQIIARHGHNIKAYNGQPGESGSFYMNYQLEGHASQLPAMVEAICRDPMVKSWAVGCGLLEEAAR
ncbi:hypothetical protein WJX72_001567 [[Myrmecia] bisecta]|uniref:Putative GTP diphosphokinase RSH1, chloroplastic n=1 Tax=[Myrmecia] bisecta TaxID=41462 RepID=A0AAW1QA84_9CHLO